ncbi:MAG: hypothetical protein HC767_04025 [Akkermansiaceae bacterium]|nr:hypothetical protein [Akkermansiaceae bacterium]
MHYVRTFRWTHRTTGTGESSTNELVVQAASVAGDFRRTVHKKLIAMEERQIAAERRMQAAKESMQMVSSDVEAARAHVAHLIAINQRLKGISKAEEEWGRKGRRAALKGVVLGPITLEVGVPALAVIFGAALWKHHICQISHGATG